MKKLFLIPLMTLMCSVMAWAADVHVSTYADLKNAVEKGSATTIYLDQDIEYRATATNTCINITRDLTIDGQGHTLTGYAGRNNSTNGTLIALNHASTPNTYSIDVTIKNFNIIDEKFRAIETRSNVGSLTIENCLIKATGTGNYQQPLTIGGNQSSAANINIINSEIVAKIYYPIITFNPVNLTITDSRIDGWCSVYFKGPDGSEGAHGSTVVATNSYFNAQNYNHGLTDTFGAFVLEDDDVDIVLDNCVVDVTAHDGTGVATQALFLLSDWATDPSLQCRMTIKGSNSHVIGDFILDDWDASVPVELELQGGSYYGDDFETAIAYDQVSVASGFHAEQVSQGGENIYRIVKDAATKPVVDPETGDTIVDPETGEPVEVLYDLNDLVEGEGVDEGNNPVSSFDLATGNTMQLNQGTTTAGYVQIQNNVVVDEVTGDTIENKPTTIQVGKTTVDTQTQEETKVDQTLVINNGLDIQGDSKLEVQAGSTLEIGKGGIVTEDPKNIVISADESGAASMIMDPAITVNTTPNLTVKMKAKAIGWSNILGEQHYFWHRFALPVQKATSWVKEPNKSTYIFGWNYTKNDWEQLSALDQMVPFMGYTLTADYENLGDIEYTFTGELAGNQNNTLKFSRNGFNFFGNSYTGYISILALVEQITGDNKIDGTVWMWYQENQSYVAVPLQSLRDDPDAFDDWQTEVAPLQTFILKQNGGENAATELNYASAVWGNPRYGHIKNPAPRRRVAEESNRMRIIVKAENGKSDFVMLTEADRFSDSYEKGYDGEKYMNENALNMYTTVEGANYSAVSTDMLAGKTVTIETVESVNYTMSFAKVNGEEYAIRDNVTGAIIAIEEGASYEFAAQPNSTVEGRFEIVERANVVTSIDNAQDNKANVKGIYTIMGQYVGENFDILPTGVYVVNGVKIVK